MRGLRAAGVTGDRLRVQPLAARAATCPRPQSIHVAAPVVLHCSPSLALRVTSPSFDSWPLESSVCSRPAALFFWSASNHSPPATSRRHARERGRFSFAASCAEACISISTCWAQLHLPQVPRCPQRHVNMWSPQANLSPDARYDTVLTRPGVVGRSPFLPPPRNFDQQSEQSRLPIRLSTVVPARELHFPVAPRSLNIRTRDKSSDIPKLLGIPWSIISSWILQYIISYPKAYQTSFRERPHLTLTDSAPWL